MLKEKNFYGPLVLDKLGIEYRKRDEYTKSIEKHIEALEAVSEMKD